MFFSKRHGFAITQDGDPLPRDHDEPTSYEEAISGPESQKWLKAMKSEMECMYTNKLWTLFDPP